MLFFYNITKKQKWKYLHFESYLLNQLRFRPVKHIKMTVWTSVLWNVVMKLPKKWPEMVVKQPFIILFRFRTVYSFTIEMVHDDMLTFIISLEW